MRKVVFNSYIPETRFRENGHEFVLGGKYEEDFPNSGIFHTWGLDTETDTLEGVASYSVALVELSDGTIEEVLPCHIKFVK